LVTPPQYEDRQHHQQREDDVELLLDRQRPVVLYRRRVVVRGEVVDGIVGEQPVLPVQRGRRELGEELLPQLTRHDGIGGGGGQDQHEQGRGQQPFGPSGPEGRQVDPAGVGTLAEQMRGDQEPGDGEEDVDADETAGEAVGPEMVERDRAHPDSTKRLDLGPHGSLCAGHVARS